MALSEIPDDRLDDVEIVRVEPAPDESRLRVHVRSREEDPAVLERLAAARGPLVGSVARSTSHRRRTPEILFTLAPPEISQEPVDPGEADPAGGEASAGT